MRRLLYLTALSVAAVLIFAPTALAPGMSPDPRLSPKKEYQG
jgi:hypothetical protein